jgi:hypothetical protein
MPKPKFDLLRHAAKIISGIPSKRFALDSISDNALDQTQANNPNHCGTVACAIGWLAMHPYMQRRGLGLKEAPNAPGFFGVAWKGGMLSSYSYVGAHVFNITEFEAQALFQPARISERWPELNSNGRRRTDKQIFRARMRELFKAYGERL